MSEPVMIEGAKGGGGQRTPVQARDSLRSIAYFRILDLVSEGEIGGLVNGLQSVYLNDTPLANPDGSLNFANAHVESRTGTQDQDYIPGYGAVENEISVGVELKSAAPWVHAIGNTQLSAVRITLGVPQLQASNQTNGDINGYTVAYHIDVQADGGAWQTALNSAFTGKTTTKFQRSHRIDLPAATTGWNVRVVRTTANANSSTITDTTTVDSYTEIIDAKLRYPNSALVAVSGDAATFSNIPTRAYDLWGRLIRVPSNYDPLARTYAGVWDGSFKIAWTNNPAWVFLDLVTHPRYGLGNLVTDAQIDKWALYAIAQYCDQSVPDGSGGTEPRFTCNVFLQTADDAYKLLGDLASLFRGIAWWAGSAIMVSADMPADASYLYTAANVIDGKFTYASSARKTRYTTAQVAWNNPANNYVADTEYVQHDAGLRRYGIQPVQMTAFGCTSRGQAQRTGQWALMTAQAETETVTFSVGLDGMLAAPGQIIRVQDAARAGKRQGGRIHAATATAVTVDKAPDAAAVGDKLICTLPSGTTETHVITAIAGAVLTVAAPGFSVAPQPESSWLTESTALVAQQFRVVAVSEDKSSDAISFTITAVQNAAAKYGAIDTSAALQTSPISALPAGTQDPVASVTVTSRQVTVQGASQTVLVIAWPAAHGADIYKVEWRRDDGEWIDAGSTPGINREVQGVYTGTYVASVRAVSAGGVVSLPTLSGGTDVVGKTVKPAPPTLTATGGQLQIALAWAWPAGVNVEDTSYTEVWVSPTSTMADGASVGAVAYPGTSYTISGLLPEEQRWAWVRLVDKSGNVGDWSLPVNAVGGTAVDLFQPLQDQADTLRADVDASIAQVSVLQGQVGDILQADAWTSTKTYPKGDLVQYGGKLYRSLIDNNLYHQPSGYTDAYWQYIGNYASLGEAVGANAAQVAVLNNTVTQQGGTITANSQSISQQAAQIAGKADASALQATNATVTQQGNAITSQGQSITGLQSSLSTTNASVTDAQNAASAASAAAANAAGIAAGKGKVLIQSSQPSATDQQAQNLWIDTTGGANTPKKWSGSAWVAVTDAAATNAAAAAVAAQNTADAAQAATSANATAISQTNTLVTQQGTEITAVASDVALLGAHNANKTAFVLDQNKVQVGGGQTFAQMLSGLQASDTSLSSRIDTESSARATGDSVNASAITALQSQSGRGANIVKKSVFGADMDYGQWYGGVNGVVWSNNPSSNYTLSVSGTAYETNPASYPCRSGDTFDVSSMLWTGSATRVRVGLHFVNGAGANVAFYAAIDVSGGGGYFGRTGQVTAPSGAVACRPWMVADGGTAYFGDIRIIPINAAQLANAGAITTLNTTVNTQGGQISAQSQSIQSLNTTVGNNSSTITTLNQSVNGVMAKAGVTTNVNGYITGWQLNNNGQSGTFTVQADMFQVIGSGTSLRWQDDVITVNNATSTTLKLGINFGADSDKLIMYYGPYRTTAAASVASATVAITQSGKLKLGGTWGNYTSGWSGAAVTYSATTTSATISVAAGTLKTSGVGIPYNASSATVSGSAGQVTDYHLYYSDPGMTGGSKALQVSTSAAVSYDNPNNVYIGPLRVTFPTSGTGGGGRNPGCPSVDAWVVSQRGFLRAGAVVVGDRLRVIDPATGNESWGAVTYSRGVTNDCVVVRTASGTALTCSTTAPIGTLDGQVLAPDTAGEMLAERRMGTFGYSAGLTVPLAGKRRVQHITCENTFFLAGDDQNYLLAHHNMKPVT